ETGRWIPRFNFACKRRTSQRQQRVVRKSAQRRTQHCRERDLVSLVVQKAEQLNQVSNFFALVKTASEHGLIRNVCAPKDGFVNRYVGHCAKQQRDVAVLQSVNTLRERENAARKLLRVEHARVLLRARIVCQRRLGRDKQLDEWPPE